MPTALITGASAGLGWAFAQQLAEEGYDLVLVARDQARLEQRADTLRSQRRPLDVEVLPADLSDPGALDRVLARVRQDDKPIDLLINNAGFGLNQAFRATTLAAEQRLLDVLCGAVLALSHAAAAVMPARGGGAILNVSSVAGFTPIGSYAAAKAWVTTFTRALAIELAGTSVQVCAVCPGLIRTEFHQRAAMNLARTPRFLWLQPERVVLAALHDLRRGRVLSIPSRRYQVLVALARLTPEPVLARIAIARDRQRRESL